MLSVLRVPFSSRVYLLIYVVEFLCGAGLIFADFLAPLGVLVVMAALAGLCVTTLAAALVISFRFLRSVWRAPWPVTFGHLVTAPMVALSAYLGYMAAPLLPVAVAMPRINVALDDYRAGRPASERDVEVISTDPDIAAFILGSTSTGFSGPGSTQLLIYDTSGHFAELASQGRTWDLAKPASLRSRPYDAYCAMGVRHWLGPFFFAGRSEVDICEPPPS